MLKSREIESDWAVHLDDCMDPECKVCEAFERMIARARAAERRPWMA
jgi:hypothetical protein